MAGRSACSSVCVGAGWLFPFVPCGMTHLNYGRSRAVQFCSCNMQMLFGSVGDKFGPRRTYGACLFLSGLSMVSADGFAVDHRNISFTQNRNSDQSELSRVAGHIWTSTRLFHAAGAAVVEWFCTGTKRFSLFVTTQL